MSQTLKPFGLKPVYHPSGLDRSVPFAGTNSFVAGVTGYSAPYALNTGEVFYQYTPVAITSSGQLTIDAAKPIYGVFDGVEYTTSEGRRTLGKSISLAQLTAASDIVFWIFQDPALVYEVQATGPVAASAIGAIYNFSTTPTYTVTGGYTIGVGGAGFSTAAITATAVTSGATGQVRVIGLGREVAYPAGELNAWSDAYTIVQVQIANNTFVAPKASV